MHETNSNTDLYELIGKHLSGDISEAEDKLLQELLTDAENKKAFDNLSNTWQKATPTMEVDTDAAWSKVKARIDNEDKKVIPISSRPYRTWWAAAASIVVIVGLFTFFFMHQSAEQLTAVANAEPQELALADGSLISLNSGSTLSYPESFKEDTREVDLKGEAFFKIERNEAKPFIIHTGDVDVKVLGTSFYVKNKNGQVDVQVVSGKVMVYQSAKPENQVILEAKQSISYAVDESSFVELENNENDLFWKTKTLVFHKSRLEDVAAIIGQYYSVQFTLNDKIKECQLTATFRNQNLDEILEVLKGTFDIDITRDSNLIKVEGESCE